MTTINIAEILSPNLSFRAQARGFRQLVEENDATDGVTVDFSGVQFASRTFLARSKSGKQKNNSFGKGKWTVFRKVDWTF